MAAGEAAVGKDVVPGAAVAAVLPVFAQCIWCSDDDLVYSC